MVSFLCDEFNGFFYCFFLINQKRINLEVGSFWLWKYREGVSEQVSPCGVVSLGFGQKRLMERIFRLDRSGFFECIGSTEIISSGLLVDNTEVLSDDEVFCSVCVLMLKQLLILFIIWMAITRKLQTVLKGAWHIFFLLICCKAWEFVWLFFGFFWVGQVKEVIFLFFWSTVYLELFSWSEICRG